MDKVIHSSPHLCPQVWTNDTVVLPQFPQGSTSLWKTVRRGGSPLPKLSTARCPQPLARMLAVGCAQRRPPRTVAAPTAIAGEVRRTPWSAGRGARGGPHRGRGRRGRASRSRATTTDPTAAGGGPLRSAGDPVVRGRRDGRVQNVATLVGGPAVRVNGEKASGAMRRRTGICAPAVGRGFAGMRGGAQGGRSEWRSDAAAGPRALRGCGAGPDRTGSPARPWTASEATRCEARANGRPPLRHGPRERPSRPPASPAGPRGPPGAPPRPRSHPPRRRRAGPAAPRRRRRTRPRRSAGRPGAPARRSRTRGRR